MDIHEFVWGYIQCAFWSSTGVEDDRPLGKKYDVGHLAPEAREQMVRECTAFIQENLTDLMHVCGRRDSTSSEVAGHLFWLTRCRHGPGFWDEDSLPDEVRKRLTEASHRAGERHLYAGDDGKLYFAEG